MKKKIKLHRRKNFDDANVDVSETEKKLDETLSTIENQLKTAESASPTLSASDFSEKKNVMEKMLKDKKKEIAKNKKDIAVNKDKDDITRNSVLKVKENFSDKVYKLNLPFTFLNREQLGKFTTFKSDNGDCQVKIRTELLNKNPSIVNASFFTENPTNEFINKLNQIDGLEQDDGFDSNAYEIIREAVENYDKNLTVSLQEPNNILIISNVPTEEEILVSLTDFEDTFGIKTQIINAINNLSNFKLPDSVKFFADNHIEPMELVNKLNKLIEAKGKGEEITVTLDNVNNLVISNVPSEEETLINLDSDYVISDIVKAFDEFGIKVNVNDLLQPTSFSIKFEGKLHNINFAENNINPQDLMEKVKKIIRDAKKDNEITVTLDNANSIIISNVDTEEEIIVNLDSDYVLYEITKALEEFGIKVSDTNFSQMNFGFRTAVRKGLGALAHPISTIGEAIGDKIGTVEAKKRGAMKKLAAMELSSMAGAMAILEKHLNQAKEYLPKDKDIQGFGSFIYKANKFAKNLQKKAQKLDNSMAAKAYENYQKLAKIEDMRNQKLDSSTMEKESTINEAKQRIQQLEKEIAEWQEKAKDQDKETQAKIQRQKIQPRQNEIAELQEKMKMNRLTEDEQKRKKEVSMQNKLENKSGGYLEDSSENLSEKSNGKIESEIDFSNVDINAITAPKTKSFAVHKVKDSEFGIVYEDEYGSLWSTNPEEDANANLLWESSLGKEEPNKSLLGLDDEENKENAESEDNGDDLGSEGGDEGSDLEDLDNLDSDSESGDTGDELSLDDDLDLGDEGEGGDELDIDSDSDDLGFSEEEDKDNEELDDLDLEEDNDNKELDELEEKSESPSDNEIVIKSLEVINNMYDKLADIVDKSN